MRKCKKVYAMIPMLLILLITGCSKKQESSEPVIESDYIQMVSHEPARVKGGEFLVFESISYYIDYEKAMAVPICSKPDCRHISPNLERDTSCNAALEYQVIFPYSGLLYGVKRSKSGNMELFASEFDGSNKKSKGEFPSGPVLGDFLLVHSKLYYTTFDLSEGVPEESSTDMELTWSVYVLDLDTSDTEKIITHTGIGNGIYLLGGTKEYQIYSMGDNTEVNFYCLDYDTNQSKQIPISGTGYQKIIPRGQKSGFYYVHVSEEEINSIHYYDMDKNKDEISVSEEEIENAINDTAHTVYLQTSFGDGFIFGAYPTGLSESGVFLKEDKEKPIQRLMLPDQMGGIEGVNFNGFVSETEAGMFFKYIKQIEIAKNEADTITWYAYIDKKALLSGLNETKDIIKPTVSGMSNPVDAEGNISY